MSRPRVLVVDDDPSILRLISSALSLQGYEVHTASHPYEALKLAHDSQCFDLLVSDVIMPDMCGPELVRSFLHHCPKVGVVVMSAHIDSHALPMHAAFLSKPFGVKDLYSVVEKALTPPTPSTGS